MKNKDKMYAAFDRLLHQELIPAMGCTEPIAIAYAAAVARQTLGRMPEEVTVTLSSNVIKNANSVVVPNTGGLKGISAAVAAGLIAGHPELKLEVITVVSDTEKQQIRNFLGNHVIKINQAQSSYSLDIEVDLRAGQSEVKLHICEEHTNIIHLEKDGVILLSKEIGEKEGFLSDEIDFLSVANILDYADNVEIETVADCIRNQISINDAIADEGLRGDYGANIGKLLLSMNDDLTTRAKARAAAASDARMSGCELPVIILSGSGNQGITACVPVVTYGRALGYGEEKIIRAVILSDLLTLHQKQYIGRLSAYCGVVCAGAMSGAGIAYLLGGSYDDIAHSIVNALAIASGVICDGAKPSCAAKIALAVDTGIMGYNMYKNGQQFYCGDGIVTKGVENTIKNVGILGAVGMKETDRVILDIMMGRGKAI